MSAMRSPGDLGVPRAWRAAMVRLMAASTSAVASSIELEMIEGMRLSKLLLSSKIPAGWLLL